MRKKLILFLIFTISVTCAYTQHKVSGVITDVAGETLPGVSIIQKGTSYGTTSDINGSYSLDVPADAILQFSFIGYRTKEVAVDGRTNIEVILKDTVTALEEVVVIGYGTQQKKLVTGATFQLGSDRIESRNVTSPLQAIQGQMAGVNITSTSGQPGEDMNINIRGLGTIGNANPLFIIDGVEAGSIDHLNPRDIESVDVLKDAASTAIYGARAANGVILITTKRGKRGAFNVNFDSYYGFQNAPEKFELLDTEQYVMIMNEQHLNSGGSPGNMPFDPNDLPAYVESGVANTNWLNEMFVENAVTQNHSLSASGGNEQSIYSLSLSYSGQEGIVGGADYSNYERYNARINSEHNLYNDRLTVGQNFTYSHSLTSGINVGGQYANTLRPAFNVSPLMPVYDDEGEFFNAASDEITDQHGEAYWFADEANPYGMMILTNQNDNNEQKLFGNLYAEIDILENLSFRSSLGIDFHADEGRSYMPIYELSNDAFEIRDYASQNLGKGFAWNYENILSYDIKTGNHTINTMAGMSARSYTGSWMYTRNTDVAFDNLEHAWIDNTTNQEWVNISIGGGPNDEDNLLSYFGRLQYDYDATYMFNTTYRADGSSKFHKDNRWGYFPSFSAGWVMTNEDFMTPVKNLVQDDFFFKIRASWGQNGNMGIPSFHYMAPIKFLNTNYAFGDEEGINTPGAFPSRLSNPDLQWETSEQTNVGFDAYFMDHALNINFDWYKKETKDWLIEAPMVATAGTDPPYINGGNVINKGIELSVSYNQRAGDFYYNISANTSYNQNEVTDIPTEDGIIHGSDNVLYHNSERFYRAQSGFPIGYFWGYETDGIFQNVEEVNNHTNSAGELLQPNARPGDVRYVNHSDDGEIGEEDKVMIGDPNPDFSYGLSFNCNYKAYDFHITVFGVAGNQIVQSYRNHIEQNANYGTYILDRWRGEGTSNTVPLVTNGNRNYQFSDLFIQDGDYLKISNVTLGVDLSKIFDMQNFHKFRLFVAGENLYTFTNYDGMDPEVGFGVDEGETDRFSSGIDLGFYPRPRTILIGINVDF